MNVFVYGTLLSGEGNHRLLEDATYLRKETILGMNMYNTGGFPAVVEGDRSITGEVYDCDEDTIQRLHWLEGYDEDRDAEDNLYNPHVVPTEYGSVLLYLWAGDVAGMPVIESGDWVNRNRNETEEYYYESQG